MTSVYFLCLAALTLAGFWIGRSHATSLASGATLHSRPVYHGLLIATAVGLSMLAVCVAGWPLTAIIAEKSALAALPADLVADPLKRSATLREILGLAGGSGAVSADAPNVPYDCPKMPNDVSSAPLSGSNRAMPKYV